MSGPKPKLVKIEDVQQVRDALKAVVESCEIAINQMKKTGRSEIFIPGLQTVLSQMERFENFSSAAVGQAFAANPRKPD